MRGFGCSDCRCSSHLFRFPRKPSLSAFERMLDLAPLSATEGRTTTLMSWTAARLPIDF
jgi:hypothetical protein